MLQQLLTSRVRTKLLTALLMHPERQVHLRGLARELDENPSPLRRELGRLEQIGLLHSERRGGARYYIVNRKHPIYPELKSLVVKTTGLGDTLRDELSQLGPIECALVYGSVARGDEDRGSDVDLLIVGQVDLERLRAASRNLETRVGREINETVYGRDEFAERRLAGDAFLERVLRGPKIPLIGNVDALH